jgi:hypothetical protein
MCAAGVDAQDLQDDYMQNRILPRLLATKLRLCFSLQAWRLRGHNRFRWQVAILPPVSEVGLDWMAIDSTYWHTQDLEDGVLSSTSANSECIT